MSLLNPKALGLLSGPAFIGGALDDLAAAYGSVADDLAGLAAPPAPVLAAPGALPYSAVYSFGDSLSDVGNLYALTLHAVPAAPYVDGHFSNGAVWVQDLAAQLGLASPQPSVLGGTGFAYGGAETGGEALHPLSPIDLPSQLAQFAASRPASAANALYTISIGANDVFDAVGAYAANPSGAVTDVNQAVANETSFVASLAVLGVRNLVVLNVPDLGKTPMETARGAATSEVASSLSKLYDAELSVALSGLAATDHLSLHLVDAYSLLDSGIANPAAYGLTNVTQPVWTGNYYNPLSGTLNATSSAQNGYLFFDSIHPTATGHAIIANAAHASLTSVV